MANLQLLESLFSGLVHPTTGALLASAQVSFYDLGTLTPQTVFSDSLGASPITPPLVLTAGGVGTVYTANPCRVIVKSADGLTTLYDIANANSSVPASQFITSTAWNGGTQTTLQTILDNYTTAWGGAAGYWKYKQSSGADEVTPKSWMQNIGIQVTDFGAIGDDATDNTTDIQAAITQLVALGGGTLIFPPGIFRISSALTTGASAVALYFKGAGQGATTLKQTGGAVNGITIGSGLTGFSIEDMTITATGSTGTGLVIASSVLTFLAKNVKITEFTAAAISGLGNGFGTGAAATVFAASTLINVSADGRTGGTTTVLTGTLDNTTIIGGSLGAIYANATNVLLFTTNAATTSSFAAIGVNLVGGNAINIPAAAPGKINILGCRSVAAVVVHASNVSSIFVTGGMEGNSADARTLAPAATTLAGSGSVTVQPGVPIRILANGAGSTVTISNPIDGIMGQRITLMCINNSGGAVTWTLNGMGTSAAIAPATANCVTADFVYDHISSNWREVSRATTAI